MRKTLAWLWMAFMVCCSAWGGIVIVENGQPRAAIVTAERPSESAARAAKELQHFIELMSGARIPIMTDREMRLGGPVKILVGRSRWLTVADRLRELGVRGMGPLPSGHDRDASREGFIIRTLRNAIVLVGNEDAIYRGTEYAVYEFLERLGCRWYFPGEFGQVVPRNRTIEVGEMNVTARPSYAVRNIWMSGWAEGTPDFEEWLIRNKGTMRNAFAFPGDGTIHRLAPVERYAESDPEIYAVGRDGVRQGRQTPPELLMLCTSYPRAVQVAASSIIEHFRRHPEQDSYGFSAPDGSPRCYCAACESANHGFTVDSGLGESISDAYFNFVNNVMHEVNRQMPDKSIVVLAYSNRVRPPEGLVRHWFKYILVVIARVGISAVRPIGAAGDIFARRHERTLRAWARIAPRVLIYDYDPHADISRMPYWRSRAIAQDMRTYKKYNVIGFTTEGQPTFLRTGLNYYMRARCMWDIATDPDAVLEDFYARFFGRAAQPMKRFIEEVESMLAGTPEHITWQALNIDWTNTYPADRVAVLGRLLDEAERLANEPEVRGRLRLYRLLHDYMSGYTRAYTEFHAGRFREAMAEVENLPRAIAAAQEIQRGLLPPDPGWVLERTDGMAYLRAFIGGVAERAGGPLGTLLALAPEKAQFRIDPFNEGLYEQWQLSEVAEGLRWDSIPLTREWGLSGYRNEEGYSYDGLAWYRFKVRVERASGGRAQLFIPLVYAEKIWVWANDHLVYWPGNIPPADVSKPLPGRAVELEKRGRRTLFIDVHDHLRFGQDNVFTFRMVGTQAREQHHGFAARPLVWVPRR